MQENHPNVLLVYVINKEQNIFWGFQMKTTPNNKVTNYLKKTKRK